MILQWTVYRRLTPASVQRLATGSDPVASPDQALDLFRRHAAVWFHRPVADLPPLHTASEHPAWAYYDDIDPEASGLLIDGSVSV